MLIEPENVAHAAEGRTQLRLSGEEHLDVVPSEELEVRLWPLRREHPPTLEHQR